jgi:hemin uptake protein HemP
VSSPCVPDPGRVIDSRDLLSGHGEILIRHGADHYRLRHTRNGKLILTK